MENNNGPIILLFAACAGVFIWHIYKSEKRAVSAHEEQSEYFNWIKEKDFPEKTKKKENPPLTLVKPPEMEQ